MLIYSLILPVALMPHGVCVLNQWLPKDSRTQQRPLFWHIPPVHPLPETRTSPRIDKILRNPPGSYQGMPHSLRRGPSFESPRLPPARATGDHYTSHNPSEKSSTSLASIWDPFGLIFSQETLSGTPDAYRTFRRRVGGKGPTATEEPPPMVYFPEGGSGACEDFNPSGFNTYSFLSFLFSVANLVGLIANNVNNNLRNNNNNNNDNNNNLGNINVANSNSNQNNENNVDIPAAMGRRRRRRGVPTDIMQGYEEISHPRERENIVPLVAMDFIQGMKRALLATDEDCVLRNFCEVNAKAVTRGPLSDVISEVFSQALVDMYPKSLPTSRDALLLAGSKGRRSGNCNSYHEGCQDARWHQLTNDLIFDDLMLDIPQEELLQELELEGVGNLLRTLSVMAHRSVLPLQKIKM